MKTYRIVSIIDNDSKQQKFLIQKKFNLLFFCIWTDLYCFYEKFENGNLEKIPFKSFSDAEAYLLLKNKNADKIIKNENIYTFKYETYNY